MILMKRKTEDIEVELIMTDTLPRTLYVYVSDYKTKGQFRLDALTGKQALDMYYHPYGYSETTYCTYVKVGNE